MKKRFSQKIFLAGFLFLGSLFFPTGSPQAAFQVGVSYSLMVFDFGADELKGLSPSGKLFGASAAYTFDPLAVELSLNLANFENKFDHDNRAYIFKMKDFFWTLGIRSFIFSSSFFFRLGISSHSLKSTLNGFDFPTNDFEDIVLTPSNGSYSAYYMGLGGEWKVVGNFIFSTEGNVYKLPQPIIYEWNFKVKYQF